MPITSELWLLVLVVFSLRLVSCQLLELESANNTKIIERPYCFRFTWIGPKYNEESLFRNATCSDIVRNDKSVPCTRPLVVTNNSNIPDVEYMWNEYRNKPTQIGCRLVKGEVCAKFSYTFNGARAKNVPSASEAVTSNVDALENITYLCTKVTIENETAVNQGCYKQMKHGHEIEVCVCESWAGRMPCNGVSSDFINLLLAAVVFARFMLQ